MTHDGWTHSKEAKAKISVAMKAAAARREALKAKCTYTKAKAARAVHIMREGKKNPMCGMKLPKVLKPTLEPVDCVRCLVRLPIGANIS